LEFLASPTLPEESSASAEHVRQEWALPARLPFLRSGRLKILAQRFEQLMAANGAAMDDTAEAELKKTAMALGLQEADASQLITERFTVEFEPIKRRMESSFVMTDEDVAETERLKSKYNVRLSLGGTAALCRAIFLLESKRRLPTPIPVDVMLDANEVCYCAITSRWHQSRVHTGGYSGASVSIPSGIKGVRFRFGGFTPVRSEQMTPLSSGTLFVTSKRLLFKGDSKSTTISLKKIVDGHVYSDGVRIDKSTGKPDLFSMDAPHARYVLSLIGALR
jgi:hypothetical protein